jgi:hypothetical protein
MTNFEVNDTVEFEGQKGYVIGVYHEVTYSVIVMCEDKFTRSFTDTGIHYTPDKEMFPLLHLIKLHENKF